MIYPRIREPRYRITPSPAGASNNTGLARPASIPRIPVQIYAIIPSLDYSWTEIGTARLTAPPPIPRLSYSRLKRLAPMLVEQAMAGGITLEWVMRAGMGDCWKEQEKGLFGS